MERREFNPTEWLLAFNINHGLEIRDAERMVFLSGQTSTAADGSSMHAGDLVAQFGQAWSALKDALAEADMDASNIVRLNMYTTDVPQFMEKADQMVGLMASDGCKPVSTLLGVTALFDPDLMIELEATAAS